MCADLIYAIDYRKKRILDMRRRLGVKSQDLQTLLKLNEIKILMKNIVGRFMKF